VGSTGSSRERTYEGGCHCGRVRFEVRTSETTVLDCNCSICRKKGFLHLIVSPERFKLVGGELALATYTFNTGIAKHHFCRTCGIASFYRPRSHPNDYDVNARCLDGDALEDFEVVPFDGENWEENVAAIRTDATRSI
jgi:hypothetical protein